MKNDDFTTIYNIPEEISGLGFISNFIGLCLFIALFFYVLSDILIEGTKWIKDIIELLTSSGILITLCWTFILIICPIYFFIRFVMELYRYKKCKQAFYSSPNIEYIKLNNDEIFFKNTCQNYDFSIKKSDITGVILDGKVKTVSYLKATRTPGMVTYTENLILTIKTANESYTIYPAIKLKNIPLGIDEIELLKQQIAFYKTYFGNLDVLFDFEGTDAISNMQSKVTTYELENEIPKFLRK